MNRRSYTIFLISIFYFSQKYPLLRNAFIMFFSFSRMLPKHLGMAIWPRDWKKDSANPDWKWMWQQNFWMPISGLISQRNLLCGVSANEPANGNGFDCYCQWRGFPYFVDLRGFIAFTVACCLFNIKYPEGSLIDSLPNVWIYGKSGFRGAVEAGEPPFPESDGSSLYLWQQPSEF